MADTYEKDLGQKSSLTMSDFIRVVGSDNVSYKQSVANVAEVVNSALSAGLQNGNIDNLRGNTFGWIQANNSSGTQPSGFAYYLLQTVKSGNGQSAQIAMELGTGKMASRVFANNSWSAWEKHPTRAEIDALTTVTTGTIEKYSNISGGTLDNMMCRKVGNTVFASARIHSISTSASGTIFVVPSGFRSPVGAIVSGYAVIDGVAQPLIVTVTIAGEVKIGYSASKTTTQVYFSGSWSVK